MSNYIGYTRTNYFRVTDADKFLEFVSNAKASGEDKVSILTREIDGELCYGFSCYGSLEGYYDEEWDEFDYDEFISDLQSILPNDEAIVITEIGNENFRYFSVGSLIVTKDMARWFDLHDEVRNVVAGMLGKRDYALLDCY